MPWLDISLSNLYACILRISYYIRDLHFVNLGFITRLTGINDYDLYTTPLKHQKVRFGGETLPPLPPPGIVTLHHRVLLTPRIFDFSWSWWVMRMRHSFVHWIVHLTPHFWMVKFHSPPNIVVWNFYVKLNENTTVFPMRLTLDLTQGFRGNLYH